MQVSPSKPSIYIPELTFTLIDNEEITYVPKTIMLNKHPYPAYLKEEFVFQRDFTPQLLKNILESCFSKSIDSSMSPSQQAQVKVKALLNLIDQNPKIPCFRSAFLRLLTAKTQMIMISPTFQKTPPNLLTAIDKNAGVSAIYFSQLIWHLL